jgi:hypothetical protein
MKKLLNITILLLLISGYSQGKIDLNTFSVPELTNNLSYIGWQAAHTNDVRELHITYVENKRKISYYFNENNQITKRTDSFHNELRMYHYNNGILEFTESRDDRTGYKKPIVYDKKGRIFSHCEITNVNANEFIYYEYDANGRISKYWRERAEDLTLSDLKTRTPYKIFKYDDKGRLIENIGQFSVETYEYTNKGTNLEIKVSNSYNGKKPTISKYIYNEYGLDPSERFAIDRKGNWTSRGGLVIRSIVYADDTKQ